MMPEIEDKLIGYMLRIGGLLLLSCINLSRSTDRSRGHRQQSQVIKEKYVVKSNINIENDQTISRSG